MIIPSKYDQQTVALTDIHSEKSPFRITTNSETGSLANAFNRVGLINPPLLIHHGNGYVVVCGHRRIETARVLDWETITARILPSQIDRLLCIYLAISENSIERSLNLIEMSRAFALLESVIPHAKERYRVAETLGLPSNPSFIEKIEPLCSFPQYVQDGILSGEIALPSAVMLSKLPLKTSVSISKLLIRLKLNLNKQKELIEIIQEISIKEDIAVEKLIESSDLQDILNQPDMDLPRKAELIRDHLKRRRFPHLSVAMDSFQKLKSDLSLGQNFFLKPSPGFESSHYHINFSFSDMSELKKHKQTLDRLILDNRIERLFDSDTYNETSRKTLDK